MRCGSILYLAALRYIQRERVVAILLLRRERMLRRQAVIDRHGHVAASNQFLGGVRQVLLVPKPPSAAMHAQHGGKRPVARRDVDVAPQADRLGAVAPLDIDDIPMVLASGQLQHGPQKAQQSQQYAIQGEWFDHRQLFFFTSPSCTTDVLVCQTV
jgi:hypothetical protein